MLDDDSAQAATAGVPTVPLAAPGRLTRGERAEVATAIGRVLASDEWIGGSEVAGFEAEFAEFVGVAHCVGVGNGTDALELALRGVGVRSGDAVVTVANAGCYASAAIRAIGAEPLYVDVDPDHHQMALPALASALAPDPDGRTPTAVVLTHLYGDARMAPAVAEACAAAGVALVEDCAQATGSVVAGRRAGAFGTAAAFSFYPTKPLGAVGDAGAVVSDDVRVAARVRRAANLGWSERFHVADFGRNSRLDPVQAAVLRLRLPRVAAGCEGRGEVRRRYAEALAGTAARLVGGVAGAGHAAHLAVVEVSDAAAVRDGLARAGVATGVHYPIPDHRQEVWRNREPGFERQGVREHQGNGSRAGADMDTSALDAVRPAALPVTEALVGRILTLPCFDAISEAEVDAVVAGLESVVGTAGTPGPVGSGDFARERTQARVQQLELLVVAEDRGRLVAGQRTAGLPFTPARFFLVSDVPAGEVRGQHAHRTCAQLLVAAAGELTVRYVDAAGPGETRLTAGGPALLIPPGIYAEQADFGPGAALLVLADEQYDPDGYLPTEFPGE